MFATPAFAQEAPHGAGQSARHDRFVISNDECGASRFAHLVGQSYAIYRTALPGDAIVHGAGATGAVNISDRVQRPTQAMTLEFRPQQLNVVIDGAARILSVGCY
jgi:hypothetical protein